jgi:signal transduction histidine kinase/ligand-binding sensor domain-containing protein
MRILLFFTLMLIALTHRTWAQEVSQPYAFLYIARDLPDKRIQAIARDSRGFVWIATYNGLFRYDGLRYKIFKNAPGETDQISFNHIGNMHIHKDKFLVIEGGRQLNILDILTEQLIYSSPPELIFKQTLIRNGLCYFHFEDTDLHSFFFRLDDAGHLEALPPFLQDGMRMDDAILDDKGQIWFFDKSGWLWQSHPLEKTLTPFDSITYAGRRLLFLPELFCDADGHIWAFDNAQPQYNGMYILDPGRPVKSGELTNRQTLIVQPKHDKVWIYNIDSKQLSEFDISSKTTTPILTLPDEVNNIRCIMRDRQENLWIGSQHINQNGILLVHPHLPAFKKFLFQDGKQQSIGHACRGIAKIHTGEMVIGGQEGLYAWNPESGEAQPIPIDNMDHLTDIKNIWKIVADPDEERIWFTKEEGGIFQYSFTTQHARNYIKPGEVSNRSLGMNLDHEGIIWIGTRSGISFFDTHTETYLGGPDSLKQFYNISGYDWVQDDDDRLWLCSSNGLYLFDRNTKQPVRRYGTDTQPFLYSNEVFDIIKDGSVYWIATDNGLHKLDHDRIIRYTTEQGLAHDVIADLLMDEDQQLWIATFNGLSKMITATGEFQNFYVEDGLPHNEFNRIGKFKAADGQLFFSTQNGVLHFQPKEVSQQVPSYDLVLTGFSTFDKNGLLQKKNVAALGQTPEIMIPAGNKYFQVEFALLNFINSADNRYSYYLEGLEDTWRPLSSIPFIQYNNLPAGTYTLHVMAITPSGHRSNNTLNLKLVILQHFYQTMLFRILILSIIFSATFALLRYRFMQQLKMEQMRNRISGDLHDEVGGVLSGIAMQMDLLETRAPDHLKPFMNRIAESSRNAALKMRDVIWSLDSSKDHVQDLVDRMKAYTLEALVPFEIAHRFETHHIDLERTLTSDTRQHIYLLFKEAMNNIIKHAHATEVEIKLEERKNILTMSIMDNGTGFAPDTTKPGHGLNNMKKRANRIGGTLDIQTGGDTSGTRVILSLPV